MLERNLRDGTCGRWYAWPLKVPPQRLGSRFESSSSHALLEAPVASMPKASLNRPGFLGDSLV